MTHQPQTSNPTTTNPSLPTPGKTGLVFPANWRMDGPYESGVRWAIARSNHRAGWAVTAFDCDENSREPLRALLEAPALNRTRGRRDLLTEAFAAWEEAHPAPEAPPEIDTPVEPVPPFRPRLARIVEFLERLGDGEVSPPAGLFEDGEWPMPLVGLGPDKRWTEPIPKRMSMALDVVAGRATPEDPRFAPGEYETLRRVLQHPGGDRERVGAYPDGLVAGAPILFPRGDGYESLVLKVRLLSNKYSTAREWTWEVDGVRYLGVASPPNVVECGAQPSPVEGWARSVAALPDRPKWWDVSWWCYRTLYRFGSRPVPHRYLPSCPLSAEIIPRALPEDQRWKYGKAATFEAEGQFPPCSLRIGVARDIAAPYWTNYRVVWTVEGIDYHVVPGTCPVTLPKYTTMPSPDMAGLERCRAVEKLEAPTLDAPLPGDDVVLRPRKGFDPKCCPEYRRAGEYLRSAMRPFDSFHAPGLSVCTLRLGGHFHLDPPGLDFDLTHEGCAAVVGMLDSLSRAGPLVVLSEAVTTHIPSGTWARARLATGQEWPDPDLLAGEIDKIMTSEECPHLFRTLMCLSAGEPLANNWYLRPYTRGADWGVMTISALPNCRFVRAGDWGDDPIAEIRAKMSAYGVTLDQALYGAPSHLSDVPYLRTCLARNEECSMVPAARLAKVIALQWPKSEKIPPYYSDLEARVTRDLAVTHPKEPAGGLILGDFVGAMGDGWSLDASEFYPSLVVAANIDPEAFVPGPDGLGHGDLSAYDPEAHHLIVNEEPASGRFPAISCPSVGRYLIFEKTPHAFGVTIRGLMERRRQCKAAGDATGQLAIKGAVNSMIGRLQSTDSPTYSYPCKVALTLLGRLVMASLVEIIERQNLGRVVATRTDSVFVSDPPAAIRSSNFEEAWNGELRSVMNKVARGLESALCERWAKYIDPTPFRFPVGDETLIRRALFRKKGISVIDYRRLSGPGHHIKVSGLPRAFHGQYVLGRAEAMLGAAAFEADPMPILRGMVAEEITRIVDHPQDYASTRHLSQPEKPCVGRFSRRFPDTPLSSPVLVGSQQFVGLLMERRGVSGALAVHVAPEHRLIPADLVEKGSDLDVMANISECYARAIAQFFGSNMVSALGITSPKVAPTSILDPGLANISVWAIVNGATTYQRDVVEFDDLPGMFHEGMTTSIHAVFAQGLTNLILDVDGHPNPHEGQSRMGITAYEFSLILRAFDKGIPGLGAPAVAYYPCGAAPGFYRFKVAYQRQIPLSLIPAMITAVRANCRDAGWRSAMAAVDLGPYRPGKSLRFPLCPKMEKIGLKDVACHSKTHRFLTSYETILVDPRGLPPLEQFPDVRLFAPNYAPDPNPLDMGLLNWMRMEPYPEVRSADEQPLPLTDGAKDALRRLVGDYGLSPSGYPNVHNVSYSGRCPVCLVVHDRSHLAVYVHPESTNVVCYNSDLHGLEHNAAVVLESKVRAKDELKDDSDLIGKVAASFPVATICGEGEKYLKDHLGLKLEARLEFIVAGMGRGKTELCATRAKEIFDEDPKARIIIISARRAGCTDYHRRFKDIPFVDYRTLHGKISLTANPQLIIQLDSLPRLPLDEVLSPDRQVDLLVLDEVESLFSRIPIVRDRSFVSESLTNMINRAKQVVALDGQMTPKTIELVKAIAGADEGECRVWGDGKCVRSLLAQIHQVTGSKKDREAFYRTILKEVMLGKTVYSYCTSQELAESVVDALTRVEIKDPAGKRLVRCLAVDGKDVRMLNSSTSMAKHKSEVFEDVNKAIRERRPDVFITTGTITTGVSIDVPFDTFVHWVDFSGMLPTEISQGLERARTISTGEGVICMDIHTMGVNNLASSHDFHNLLAVKFGQGRSTDYRELEAVVRADSVWMRSRSWRLFLYLVARSGYRTKVHPRGQLRVNRHPEDESVFAHDSHFEVAAQTPLRPEHVEIVRRYLSDTEGEAKNIADRDIYWVLEKAQIHIMLGIPIDEVNEFCPKSLKLWAHEKRVREQCRLRRLASTTEGSVLVGEDYRQIILSTMGRRARVPAVSLPAGQIAGDAQAAAANRERGETLSAEGRAPADLTSLVDEEAVRGAAKALVGLAREGAIHMGETDMPAIREILSQSRTPLARLVGGRGGSTLGDDERGICDLLAWVGHSVLIVQANIPPSPGEGVTPYKRCYVDPPKAMAERHGGCGRINGTIPDEKLLKVVGKAVVPKSIPLLGRQAIRATKEALESQRVRTDQHRRRLAAAMEADRPGLTAALKANALEALAPPPVERLKARADLLATQRRGH